MQYWIITDTHFNHQKLIDYGNRPNNSDAKIKENLINTLKEDDVLIHLGDICMGLNKENNNWFRVLKCKRILVKGNHDKKSNTWYMKNGWDFVCDRFDLKIFGKLIAFSHKPLEDDKKFNINIHGHFHDTDHRIHDPEFNNILTIKHKLLAIENTNYMPVSLQKFIC